MKEKMTALFSKKFFFAMFLVLIASQLLSMFSIDATENQIIFDFSLDFQTVLQIVTVGLLYFYAMDKKPVDTGLRMYNIVTRVFAVLGCVGGGALVLSSPAFFAMKSLLTMQSVVDEFTKMNIDITSLNMDIFNFFGLYFLVLGALVLTQAIIRLSGLKKMTSDYSEACLGVEPSGNGITALTVSYVFAGVIALVSFLSSFYMLSHIGTLVEFAEALAQSSSYTLGDIAVNASVSVFDYLKAAVGIVIPAMYVIALSLYRKALLAPADNGEGEPESENIAH